VPAGAGAAEVLARGWHVPFREGRGGRGDPRSWRDRFGARLCSLEINTLVLAIAYD